jgi:hypothetical protein
LKLFEEEFIGVRSGGRREREVEDDEVRRDEK